MHTQRMNFPYGYRPEKKVVSNLPIFLADLLLAHSVYSLSIKCAMTPHQSAVMSSESKPPTPTPGDTYKGWLFKWTNYIKGYQRRWFVLSNGLLSYYR